MDFQRINYGANSIGGRRGDYEFLSKTSDFLRKAQDFLTKT